MMSERIDDFARTVAPRTTRRSALMGLGALALGGLGILGRGQGTAASNDNDNNGAQADASAASPTTETIPQTGYAPVNGLQMYYEIHGSGEPLVLLHGAFGAIDLWGPILTTLAENHQVIAVEQQGHGHTADIDRPFSYEQMADDVAALMDHLAIVQADIVGYSMGADTALQVAIRHPERVRKLVPISGKYRYDGEYPELLAVIQQLTPDFFAGTPMGGRVPAPRAEPGGVPAAGREDQSVLWQGVCLARRGHPSRSRHRLC